jgi:hypothetical protein
MPYSLKGRNVLVTGGSRGLGALICERFAEEGANIMINYVSAEDKAKEVAEKVKQRGVKASITKGVYHATRHLLRMLTCAGCWRRRRQRTHRKGDCRAAWGTRHHHRQRWLD